MPNMGRKARPIFDRLWERVAWAGKTADECWPWTGYTNPDGYGIIGVANGYNQGTHRVAYTWAFGEMPPGSLVLHRCDNPPCCNPSHLFLGNDQANSDDKVAKNRHARGPSLAARVVATTPRGEQRARAKLSDEAVRTIRREIAEGLTSRRELARRFGVSLPTVLYVLKGKTWTHVS